MPLLNYTTEVAVAKTIGEIQTLLMRSGARSILSNFDDAGRPESISFAVATAFGPREFALPVHPDRVLAVLRKQRVAPRYQNRDQAERVAWRITKDWLEAQLAIISTEMVTLEQVMLPYMRSDDGRTVWELLSDQQLALGAGRVP